MICPTHLYGFPADLDSLKRICKKKKIYLVEDCSQASGTKYKGKKVGSFGDFNIHSFHNKLIASGEGGMITTNNKNLAITSSLDEERLFLFLEEIISFQALLANKIPINKKVQLDAIFDFIQ